MTEAPDVKTVVEEPCFWFVADTGCAAVLAVRQADGSQIAGAMKLDGTGRSGLRK